MKPLYLAKIIGLGLVGLLMGPKAALYAQTDPGPLSRLLARSSYANAEKQLGEQLQKDSTSVAVRYQLGRLYSRTNRLNEAEQEARWMLARNPDSVEGAGLLAEILEAYGEADSAAGVYKMVLAARPASAAALHGLAWFYIRQKKYGSADSLLQERVRQNKEDSEAYRALAALWRARRNRGKEKEYVQACVRADSSNVAELASYYFEEHSAEGYREARKWYRKALEKDPDDLRALLRLGMIEWYSNQVCDAFPLFWQVYHRDPSQLDALYWLARCYTRSNLHTEAAAYWKRLLKQAPTDRRYIHGAGYPVAHLAGEYISQGKTAAAVRALGELGQMGHRQAAELAYALRAEQSRDYETAQYWYRKAAFSVPFHSLAQRGLLRLYDEQRIRMDSSDYRIWKTNLTREMQTMTVPAYTRLGTRPVSVYIFHRYPAGMKPLEPEKARLLLEEDEARIPDDLERNFVSIYRDNRFEYNAGARTFAEDARLINEQAKRKQKLETQRLALSQELSARFRGSLSADEKREANADYYQKMYRLYDDHCREDPYPKSDSYGQAVVMRDAFKRRAVETYLSAGKARQEGQNPDFEKALQNFRAALAVDPASEKVISELAKSYLLAGQGDSLRAHYARYRKVKRGTGWYEDLFQDELRRLAEEGKRIRYVDTLLRDQIFKEMKSSVFQRIRRGDTLISELLQEPDSAIVKHAARYYQARRTGDDDQHGLELYRELQVRYPKDTSLLMNELALLLDMQDRKALGVGDTLRAEQLYGLVKHTRNPRILTELLTLVRNRFYSLNETTDSRDVSRLEEVRTLHSRLVPEGGDRERYQDRVEMAYKALLRQDFAEAQRLAREAGKKIPDDDRKEHLFLHALAGAYLGNWPAAETEIRKIVDLPTVIRFQPDADLVKKREDLPDYAPEEYTTFGELMLYVYANFKKKEVSMPQEKLFTATVTTMGIEDLTLRHYDILTDKDLVNASDPSRQKLWLDLHLYESKTQAEFEAKKAAWNRIVTNLFQAEQLEDLVLTASALRKKAPRRSDGRFIEDDYFFATEALRLFERIADKVAGRKTPGANDIRESIAEVCGRFSYQFLVGGKYAEGLATAELAYRCNPKENFVRTNLPLALLLNNQYARAEPYYRRFADERWTADRRYATYREAFLDDFNDFRRREKDHPEFRQIEQLLKSPVRPPLASN
ncbi:tetratricopeptide repeat protein [Tellurirhabdus rosea]|uniref:tetratricopeptide repeat protein n=1 Tax=Tellurirhabdus rosea TaxID=2674997 RepID=UPI00225B7A7C|nr:tetratricopeptide repeat protein [Tellurirhabdus rosea]